MTTKPSPSETPTVSQAKVLVMRSPVLMEDEGRHFYILGPVSKDTAESWIADQKDQFFKPGDYYIATCRPEDKTLTTYNTMNLKEGQYDY